MLRRLDCVWEATKAAVLAEKSLREAAGLNHEPFLLRKAGQFFYNTSPLDLKKLMGDQDPIGENLRAYLQAFSPEVRDIFESFEFHTQIDKLAKSGLLSMVTEKFATASTARRTWSKAAPCFAVLRFYRTKRAVSSVDWRQKTSYAMQHAGPLSALPTGWPTTKAS